LSSEVNQPAAGRSDANLNRTHAPAIARIDAPFHDVAAVIIIVVIGVVRIIVIVVVGIGSVQTQTERGTDEGPAMVKAAVVKSTGPEACEPTRPESCTAVEGAGPANGCRAERPGCTNSGRTKTANGSRAEATAPRDWSETPASCHRGRAEAAASGRPSFPARCWRERGRERCTYES